MVQFRVKLESESVKKWRAHYIEYARLDESLTAADRDEKGGMSPSSESVNSFAMFSPSDFGVQFQNQLRKVNSFFESKMGDMKEGLERQREQLQKAQVIVDADDVDAKDSVGREVLQTESLRRSLLNFYRQTRYLHSFCIVNYTGFVKILKKYKKRYIHRAEQGSGHQPSSGEDLKSSLLEHPHGDVAEASADDQGSASLELGDNVDLSKALEEALEAVSFVTAVRGSDGSLNRLVGATEQLYASQFCGGDLVQAQATLLSRKEAGFNWMHFQLGYRFGACLILLFWILWDAIVDTAYRPPKDAAWLTKVFPIYRGFACVLLLVWLVSLMMTVWRSFRINYLYIFEIDPRMAPNNQDMYLFATNISIALFINFLLYYKVLRGDFPAWIPAAYYPIMLVPVSLVYAIMNWSVTRAALGECANVFKALWLGGRVSFLSAFIADVWTSMAKVWVDLAYTGCITLTGEWADGDINTRGGCSKNFFFTHVVKVIVTVMPLWLRLMQNVKLYRETDRAFPFIANAGKYLVSVAVTLFSTLHGLSRDNAGTDAVGYTVAYTLVTCVATIYSYVWDITMDWGLARKEHRGLRARLMYGNRWVYWVCIALDLFGRFAWTVTLMPLNNFPVLDLPVVLVPFLAALELCRRAMWACFRLENEHLHNTGYRRTDGPVPDHFDTVMTQPPKARKKSLAQVAMEVSIFVGFGGAILAIAIYFGLEK